MKKFMKNAVIAVLAFAMVLTGAFSGGIATALAETGNYSQNGDYYDFNLDGMTVYCLERSKSEPQNTNYAPAVGGSGIDNMTAYINNPVHSDSEIKEAFTKAAYFSENEKGKAEILKWIKEEANSTYSDELTLKYAVQIIVWYFGTDGYYTPDLSYSDGPTRTANEILRRTVPEGTVASVNVWVPSGQNNQQRLGYQNVISFSVSVPEQPEKPEEPEQPEGELSTTVEVNGSKGSETAEAEVKVPAGEKSIITDVKDTIDYENLVKGNTYKVQGTLMLVAEDGSVSEVAKSEAEDKVAEDVSGTWEIVFKNVTLEVGKKYVVFESATPIKDAENNEITDGKVIEHNNPEDKAQTVVVTEEEPTEPEEPKEEEPEKPTEPEEPKEEEHEKPTEPEEPKEEEPEKPTEPEEPKEEEPEKPTEPEEPKEEEPEKPTEPEEPKEEEPEKPTEPEEPKEEVPNLPSTPGENPPPQLPSTGRPEQPQNNTPSTPENNPPQLPSTGTPGVPNTGDESNMILWMSLATLAAISSVVIRFVRRER